MRSCLLPGKPGRRALAEVLVDGAQGRGSCGACVSGLRRPDLLPPGCLRALLSHVQKGGEALWSTPAMAGNSSEVDGWRLKDGAQTSVFCHSGYGGVSDPGQEHGSQKCLLSRVAPFVS